MIKEKFLQPWLESCKMQRACQGKVIVGLDGILIARCKAHAAPKKNKRKGAFYWRPFPKP
jgi:hypothetical protein